MSADALKTWQLLAVWLARDTLDQDNISLKYMHSLQAQIDRWETFRLQVGLALGVEPHDIAGCDIVAAAESLRANYNRLIDVGAGRVRVGLPPLQVLSDGERRSVEDCVRVGGHCFESLGVDSLEDKIYEKCKHCLSIRVGQSQAPVEWEYFT